MSPVVMSIDRLRRRRAAQTHVLNKNLAPIGRLLTMDLKLYWCQCGQWASWSAKDFAEHFDAMVARDTEKYDDTP